MNIRYMKKEDKEIVLKMVEDFYHTDAVTHGVDRKIMEKCFHEALFGIDTFQGIVMEENSKIVGYAYLTTFFTTETGELTQMIEQVYVSSIYRGRGYGTQFFHWLEQAYPQVTRFRLEVNETNEKAILLYQKLGYSFLEYGQMIKTRD